MHDRHSDPKACPGGLPDLGSYEIIIANSSAGKDSSAMLDYLVEQAAIFGVIGRIVVVHADLGEMEWPGTRELAEEHAAAYGLPFIATARRTRADGGEPQAEDLLAHIRRRGMFPDAARRYCTSDHKRGPILRVMTELVRARIADGCPPPVRVLSVMGFRAQESRERARREPFCHDARASNGRRHVDVWLPLHAWSEAEVWRRVRASGLRVHRAYIDHGMPRLSCRLCVLASRSALIASARANPQLARRYREVEAEIGHRFRRDLSMAQIIELARTPQSDAPIDDWSA